MRRTLPWLTLLPLVLVAVTAARAIPEDSEVNGAATLHQHGEHRVMVPGVTRAGQEPSPTPVPTPTPRPEPTAAPSPSVELSITEVFQGGAIHVHVAHAQAGSVQVLGRDYTLSPSPGGGLEGLVGIAIGDGPGPAVMRIDVAGLDGETYTFERAFTVLQTDWLVEEIWFPTPTPGPTPTPDPDPPPPLPNDNEILPGVYAGMSPRQWTGNWILPIDEPDLASCESEASGDTACVSSYFGTRRSFNGGPVGGHHGGTDLAAWAGTPVRSTNHGTVVLAGEYRVRGNLVVVDHGGGVFSSYGHLSSIAVSEGEVVRQGDKVGEVGSTGLSTGPHLHWEMSVSGVLVDGLRWLDESQGF